MLSAYRRRVPCKASRGRQDVHALLGEKVFDPRNFFLLPLSQRSHIGFDFRHDGNI
jgi:hypothetical protein